MTDMTDTTATTAKTRTGLAVVSVRETEMTTVAIRAGETATIELEAIGTTARTARTGMAVLDGAGTMTRMAKPHDQSGGRGMRGGERGRFGMIGMRKKVGMGEGIGRGRGAGVRSGLGTTVSSYPPQPVEGAVTQRKCAFGLKRQSLCRQDRY